MIRLDKQKVLLLSDTHYGKKNPEGSEKILEFLKVFDNYEILILIGDIFDFLYDPAEKIYGDNKIFFDLLTSLNKQIFFLPGNHDFWGSFSIKKAGFHLYERGLGMLYKDEKYFLHHGDNFNKKDYGHIILKAITQSNFSYKIVSSIIPSSFFQYHISKISKTDRYRDPKEHEINSIIRYSALLARKYDLNAVITGHSHKPCIKIIEDFAYINCGDWIRQFSYVMFEQGSFSLHYYK